MNPSSWLLLANLTWLVLMFMTALLFSEKIHPGHTSLVSKPASTLKWTW